MLNTPTTIELCLRAHDSAFMHAERDKDNHSGSRLQPQNLDGDPLCHQHKHAPSPPLFALLLPADKHAQGSRAVGNRCGVGAFVWVLVTRLKSNLGG